MEPPALDLEHMQNTSAYLEILVMPRECWSPNRQTSPMKKPRSFQLPDLKHCIILEKQISNREKVLIIGAGGSIGTYAIQLARHFGAEVTGVDSTDKQELMRSLGANHVIDYTKEDYTRKGEKYDLIIDVVGRKGVSRRLKLLKPDGVYFLAYAGLADIVLSMWVSMRGSKKLKIESSSQNKEDLLFLKALIEEGKLKSVIDRRYPLEQVPTAHGFAETGQKKGNIVICVD